MLNLLKDPKVQSVLRMIYDLKEDELRFIFGMIRLLKEERPVRVKDLVEEECC
ncbi:hypothetical protein [Heliorestis convoluta]|uniref:Helix-turn-helix domain-containing protein n=1 Tax=Heliorestis convoluta TaxID=356322 RepID=A0A5Q2N2N5_9FIRM|nr:hypothetical protein [Heliorestis convoluta]QGG47542.1 helix-turn-helix domain-containing protein [Heliorestis convoluta]